MNKEDLRKLFNKRMKEPTQNYLDQVRKEIFEWREKHGNDHYSENANLPKIPKWLKS
jgi:hypothetical protein